MREEWRAVGAELEAAGFQPLGAQRREYDVGSAEEFSRGWGSPCGRFIVSSSILPVSTRGKGEFRKTRAR